MVEMKLPTHIIRRKDLNNPSGEIKSYEIASIDYVEKLVDITRSREPFHIRTLLPFSDVIFVGEDYRYGTRVHLLKNGTSITVSVGQVYKHYMGNVCVIVVAGIPIKSGDKIKEYVLFRALNNPRTIWARPINEFFSKGKNTDIDKYVLVSENETADVVNGQKL